MKITSIKTYSSPRSISIRILIHLIKHKIEVMFNWSLNIWRKNISQKWLMSHQNTRENRRRWLSLKSLIWLVRALRWITFLKCNHCMRNHWISNKWWAFFKTNTWRLKLLAPFRRHLTQFLSQPTNAKRIWVRSCGFWMIERKSIALISSKLWVCWPQLSKTMPMKITVKATNCRKIKIFNDISLYVWFLISASRNQSS
jgi:hypothetical protein